MKNTLIIVILSAVAFGSAAQAGEPAAADQIAKDAFNRACELFEDGDYSAAAIQFRTAYENKPSWKLLYNIGQCETGARRYGLALEAFEQYLVEAGDEITEQRRVEVQNEIKRLQTMVGMLKIKGPEGAEIFVDGQKRGVLPITRFVAVSAATDHVLDGVLNSEKFGTQTINLMVGQIYEVTLQFDPRKQDELSGNQQGPDNEMSPGEPAAPPRKSKLKTLGVSFLSAGLALAVGGFTAGGISYLKAKDIDDSNPDGVSLSQSSEINSLRNVAIAGDVLMGVGASIAISGAIMLIASKKKNEAVKTSLVPILNGTTGAAVVWSF